MDEITRKVVISVRAFVQRLAQSDALSSHQVTEALMADAVLGYELARTDYDPSVLSQVRQSEHALVGELAETLGKGDPVEVPRAFQASWETGVGADLARMLAAPSRGAPAAPDAEIAAARRIRDFLVAYHTPLDPSIGDGPHATYRGGRSERTDQQERSIYITAPALETYLRTRFADHRATTVTDVRRITGGFSKETYIVTLRSGEAESRFVIRKDGAGLPTGSSVVDEYKSIEAVLRLGVRAPQLLWLEEDGRHFGTAYMAVEFVDGTPAHLNVPKEVPLQKKWAESLARTLALLHASTAAPDIDVRDTIRRDLEIMQRRLTERERSPHPGIAFGIAWLTDHLDDLKGRPACRVHGDVGFHNMLIGDDELKVLLDWEFSHFSDPVEDLIYVKPFMDDLGAWQAFLTAYQAGAPFTMDAKAGRYFEVWKSLRNAVACVGSLNSLLLPDVKDIALALAGNVYIPKFEVGVLDSVIAATDPSVTP